jgi:ribonuclease P protein component
MSPSEAPVKPEQVTDGKPGGAMPDTRLPRSRRLRNSDAFKEAFDQGRKYPGTTMVLWVRRGADAALRVGVVAAKRSFRRAVDRARAKRLMREAFRLSRHQLDGAVDLVLLARYRILGVGEPEVRKDLMILARRAGLVRSGKNSGAA